MHLFNQKYKGERKGKTFSFEYFKLLCYDIKLDLVKHYKHSSNMDS